MITVQCPAKINLTLKITGKRPDGFHNIESIMQTISLYDYLTIDIKPSDKLEIHLSGNCNEIPYNEHNLVYKAAKLFFESLQNCPLNPNPSVLDFFHAPKVSPNELRSVGSISSLSGTSAVQKSVALALDTHAKLLLYLIY